MLVSDKAREAGVDLKVETLLEDDGCFLDRDQIKQVVLNLVMNAIEACDAGGGVNVRLGLAEDPSNIIMLFEDNGCGISPEHLERLFQHGFSTKPNGHGFGLHTSAIAARTMNGSLEAHSDGLDRGARIRLTLPRILP